MNVLLISQCDKRALTETRRILDQFAERRGDRTWQTAITLEGLNTLRRLLKKTARKNTAVACHWIRGLDHSELLWIVGDSRQFNARGAVPTNATSRNVLRRQDENDWHTLQDIYLLSALAALLHDLGKACKAFQDRLIHDLLDRNQYRHEWVSLRLFEAFVGDDDDVTWLARLAAPTETDDACWIHRLKRDGLDGSFPSPFEALCHAPLAQAIGWLIVTHHRLPKLPRNADGSRAEFQIGWLHNVLTRIDATWNEQPTTSDRSAIEPYWTFPYGLPVTTPLWRKQTARVVHNLLKLLAQPDKGNWVNNPYVMHISRLCLMLADHRYSSLEGQDSQRVLVPPGYPLYANTTARSGEFNQTLDEHLIGVARFNGEISRALPRFEEHLPRLGRSRRLHQRAQNERFRWQDKAAEMAAALRERSAREGAFLVNMASTGSGKTLANARVMYALADPAKGMRCAFALGLRTLTLQTGRAFRDLLGLSDDELAIRVGSSASRELLEYYENLAEQTGSASRQPLLGEEEGCVEYFEGNEELHRLLRHAMQDPNIRKLLAAPLLVCTIDHLTPATESDRGGRQIAPMLRLMSGDLVLDEPDDFDINDLPALTRLVHWTGLLGSRVLLSSATLPPALVQGLFEAYRNGRQHFQRNRGDCPGAVERPPEICCAWVDEFHQLQKDCVTPEAFEEAHSQFTTQRHAKLTQCAEQGSRRQAKLVDLPLQGLKDEDLYASFAQQALASVVELHTHHHNPDSRSGKRVSFGLIRMANIEPLYEVALALYRLGVPTGKRIHLCVYHSQFPLLLRSNIEQRLDATLNRRQAEAVFALPDIRRYLDTHPEPDQMFVVLGSPVTEVGRDHDYDWAVVEPSSMRSLIQLAGRVKRHRDEPCTTPNIHIFRTNLRHFREPGQPAFCKPGFETRECMLSAHDLATLLSEMEIKAIDARPRIILPPVTQLRPDTRLVDLEHARMRQTMLPQVKTTATSTPGTRQRGSAQAGTPTLNAATWWSMQPADALLTALLPQQQRFRRDDAQNQVNLLLLPNEDGDAYELFQQMDGRRGSHRDTLYVPVDRSQHHPIMDSQVQGAGINPWGKTNYLEALGALASEQEMSLDECAHRFGTVTVRKSDSGWRFHPTLGFATMKA